MKNKKLHLAFLISNQLAGRGGLESVMKIFSEKLAFYNIAVTCIFLIPPVDRSFLNDIDYLILPQSTNIFRKTLPKIIWQPLEKLIFKKKANAFLLQIMTQKKFNALLSLNLSKNFLNIVPSIKKHNSDNSPTAIIAWPHGTLNSLQKKELDKFKNLDIFDHMLAISQGIELELKEIYPLVKSSLIYNPIPLPKKIPIRVYNKFIIMARVNDPNKRIIELLKIMSKLTGDWSVDIFGEIGSENQTIETKKLIQELKITSKVTLHGWNDNPWSQIDEAGILILNSLKEGLPMCLLEAISRGIPCISSDCPTGPSEIIKNNENGWLYDINDEGRCLELLQKIINKELELPSQDNVILSSKKFTELVVLNNFQTALHNVINEK